MIPPTLRQRVREELHEGHFGGNRMKAIARSFVWWPNLDKELDDVTKACKVCQSQRNKPATAITHPWVYPNCPWESVHIDFAEYEGHQLLIMVDSHSKWIEVEEMGRQARPLKR